MHDVTCIFITFIFPTSLSIIYIWLTESESPMKLKYSKGLKNFQISLFIDLELEILPGKSF